MRLYPEFEQSRAQLLYSPTGYTLDEAFALVLVEETRLRATSSSTGTALAAQRFAPLAPHPLTPTDSSSWVPPRPKKNLTYCHYGLLGHIERDYRKK